MTMVTNTSPKAGAKPSRQQRRHAARLAKKGRRRNGATAPAGTAATVRDIEIATGFLQSGNVRKASEICERLLATYPNHSAALHVMGMAAMTTARFLDAVDLFKRAAAGGVRNPRIRLNLGSALGELGRFEEAAACFREAISLKPDYVRAHDHLGTALRAQGKTEEAIAVLCKAVKLSPNDPGAYYTLGCALAALGNVLAEVECYLQALSIKPDFAKCRRRLVHALGGVSCSSASEPLLREIEACLSADDVDKQALVKATLSILKLDGDFAELIASPHEDEDQTIEAHCREGALRTVMESRIFRLLLRHTILTDLDFEIGLAALRKIILLQIASGDGQQFEPQGWKFAFLCSLAEQCFNNEYVYSVSDEERRDLEELEERIEAGLRELPRLPDELQVDLVCLAMYKPLHALNGGQDLPRSHDEAWKEPARPIAKRQLDDHDEEGRIASAIEPITGVCDAVSLAVKQQYEENPYPRWLSVDRDTPRPASFVLKVLFPHFTPPAFLDRPPQILVAGCGTGRHAIMSASRFMDAEVLAVDLSARSLAYGTRMARELGVANVRFRQGDILALTDLDKRFEIVECAGVLHHMADPIAGWRVLVDLLQPHGLMRVGLYSARARDCLSAGQEWLKRNGLEVSEDSIRRFRQSIFRLPNDDPDRRALTWKDFYTMSDCRDLLFHVQEHRFTLPQLERIFKDLGLRFLGFEFKDPTPKRTYQSLFPKEITMTDLRLWDELEAKHPHTFKGMYQFWCQKI